MFGFINLGSGSKGNATIVYSDDGVLLIDMGLTKAKLKEGLALINKQIDDLDGVLVTHDHNDHIKGLGFVSHKPLYGREGVLSYREYKETPIADFAPVEIGGFNVTVLPTSHDAPSPGCYLIEYKGKKLAYVTDTGSLKKPVLAMLRDCECYIFESNYDIYMLEHSGRPKVLIRRIEGTKGHLGNIESSEYLLKLIGPHTKKVFLAHISEECNDKKIVLEQHRGALEGTGVEADVLWQWKTTRYEL